MFNTLRSGAFAAAAVILSLGAAAPASALGPIVLDTDGHGVVAQNEWAQVPYDIGFRIDSSATQLAGGIWKYSYHISGERAVAGSPGSFEDLSVSVKTLIIEVAPGYSLSQVMIPGTFSDGGKSSSQLITDSTVKVTSTQTRTIHGLRIQMLDTKGVDWTFTFNSYNAPILGNFYAIDKYTTNSFADREVAFNQRLLTGGSCTTGNCIVTVGAVVPEPATYAALGVMLGVGLVLLRRRRAEVSISR